MRHASPIVLTDEEKAALEALVASGATPQRFAVRARLVLLAARGLTNEKIASRLKMGRVAVGRWRDRYARARLAGIERDAPGRGRKASITPERVTEVVRLTQQSKPKGRTHWSRTSMAERAGMSESSVGRIWRQHGLKPHRVETFKVSNDPQFESKLVDVIGLYTNPPEHAVVFSVDEKSQVQALDRTQPGLPIKKGRAGTMTHDYKRHGTTTLFAALNVLTGLVIAECMPRHKHTHWLKFLQRLDQRTPVGLDIHVICDNYSTHKHARVQAWLTRHPRFTIHFTPTSGSWLNLVERWFAELTGKAVRRGSFASVPDLIEAIFGFIEQGNKGGKAFVWTAKAKAILEKLERCRVRLEQIKPGCTSWRSRRRRPV